MASAATAGVMCTTSTRYSARKPVNTSTSRSATSISSSQRSVPQSRSALPISGPISLTRAVHGLCSAFSASASAAAGRPSASGRPRSSAPSQISALIPASTR